MSILAMSARRAGQLRCIRRRAWTLIVLSLAWQIATAALDRPSGIGAPALAHKEDR